MYYLSILQAGLDPWEVRQYWDRVRTERNLKSYQSKKVQPDITRTTNTQIPLKKMLADSAIKRAKMGIKVRHFSDFLFSS